MAFPPEMRFLQRNAEFLLIRRRLTQLSPRHSLISAHVTMPSKARKGVHRPRADAAMEAGPFN